MISIIVPVYNVERYLPQCLDSLIGQTYQDLEIICVNDGSTDGSMSLVEAQCSGLPCVISDRVPREACLTDLICRLSLSANIEDWASAIIRSAAARHDRQSYAQQIAEAGYDIAKNALWLQHFYISTIK